MKFFVSPPEAGGEPLLRPEELASALRGRWPDAEIDEGPFGVATNRLLEWRLPVGARIRLEGGLDREGTGVVIQGEPADVVRFALWLRGQVPEDRSLLLYDEAFLEAAELTRATTEEELRPIFVEDAPLQASPAPWVRR